MPTTKTESLVLVSKQNGFVIIPAATPLTRLNYFDGKFLRASDLNAEQNYLRQLVAQSNQAGGAGVAHGFDLTLAGGDTLEIGPGLAIDPSGRVLLLPQGTTIGVQELIDKSRDLQRLFGGASVVRAGTFERCELDDGPLTGATAASNLYLIVISPAEALCGEEDVYGKLCEEACATSTDRPFAVEGLTVRAIPLVLQTPLPSPRVVALTQAHLRSRVASAYFEDERRRVASLISGFGLQQETWCLGSDAAGGSGVPIGVIARSGSTTIFLDPWIARRERIDAPAKRYWQWRMMMRPWDVFLAQVLQFQCQLHDLFRKTPVPGDVDPCGGARGALREAADTISELRQFYTAAAERFLTLNVNPNEFAFQGGATKLTSVHDRLVSVGQALAELPTDRFLINGGIVELPSAGYLPVVPGAATATINQQVRRLMGEGVDLRFCVVRPDYVAHALEEAQHMERISLLQGLDDPRNKPEVDILVPNGEILEQKQLSPGRGFEASVDLNQALFSRSSTALIAPQPIGQALNFRGVARTERLATGGGAFYLSGDRQDRFFSRQAVTESVPTAPTAINPVTGAAPAAPPTPAATPGANPSLLGNIAGINANAIVQVLPQLGLWISLRCDSNVFDLAAGDTANFNARAVVASSNAKVPLLDVDFNGVFNVNLPAGATQIVTGQILSAQLTFSGIPFGNPGAPKTISVSPNAKITLTGSSAVEILLQHTRGELALKADWAGDPLKISATIVEKTKDTPTNAGPTEVVVAHADLKENADVLSAQNASHIQARAALDVIAVALSDANFADAKGRLLFPPPPKPTDELLVRATMDWVLFHRRRNKSCRSEVLPPPPPPPVKTVCHSVYRVEDAGAFRFAVAQISQATTAAEMNAAIQRAKLKLLGEVQFKEGTADVAEASSLINVVNAWNTAGGGQASDAVIVCAQPTPQEEQFRKQQLNKIRVGIGTIEEGDGDLITTIAPLPTDCPVFSIISVNAAQVSESHTVFKASQRDQFERALKLITDMTSGDISQVISNTELGLLGDVLFGQHSSTFWDGQSIGNVVTAWANQGGGVVSTFAVIQQQSQQEDVREAQGKAIAGKINGAPFDDGNVKMLTVPDAVKLPTGAPVFAIALRQEDEVVVVTVCVSVYQAQNSDNFASAIRALSTLQPNGNIQSDVIVRNKLQLINNVQFAGNSTNVLNDSLTKLVNDWKSTANGRAVLNSILVCRNPKSPEEDKGLRDQAVTIRDGIGAVVPPPPPQFLPVNDTVVFPTSCRAIMIVLPRPQG